jgi:prepilin-type N-terminal cleavage/methylation domain-containing protein/prepilin-type processing-associated H-X9-DG protein
MYKKGFTLIELLVVIAIMAILAAILFPVYNSAKEKAKQTTCISNLSQLAKAMMMYLDDNGDRFPGPGTLDQLAAWGQGAQGNRNGSWIWFKGSWSNSGGFWYNNPGPPPSYKWTWAAEPSYGSLWKYTNRSRNIYICPSDKHARASYWTMYGAFGLSYDLNCELIASQGRDTPGGSPALFSEITRPTRTVMFADHGDGSWNKNAVFMSHNGGNPVQTPCFDGVYRWWQEAPTPVHTGGLSWAYCDGHVKWMTLKQYRTISFFRSGIPHRDSDFTNPYIGEVLD